MMNITISKNTAYQYSYALSRPHQPVEQIVLDTGTFFLHDICHYAVEKSLQYRNGFWGMLAQGHAFPSLFGKENILTEELRFIEKIVGPVQSVYLGHIPRPQLNQMIQHLAFPVPEPVIDSCLGEIKKIMNDWQYLAIGQQITLEWNL